MMKLGPASHFSSRSGCGCITSIGAILARRRCCCCTAAATIAVTGTGSPGHCATTTTSSRPTCAGMAIQRGPRPATTRWPSYIYDLAQLVHQQKLAPVSIIAHSLGGNIALRYTGIYPEAVRRLVAIEGLGPAPRAAAEGSASRLPNACAPGSSNSEPMRAASRGATQRSRMRWPACRRRTSTCRRSKPGI